MSDTQIFGARPVDTPPDPVPGAPDTATAGEFNQLTGPPRRRGRRVASTALMVAAVPLVLAVAVTTLLRLGVLAELTAPMIAALAATSALVGCAVLVAGRSDTGRRSLSGTGFVTVLVVGALLIVGLYVWAVI
jgi:membrane associated rhomboid family serine protease